jgi:hypothetical protein
MMCVEILLPLRDNQGSPLPEEPFQRLQQTLTHRFGGLTSFTRSPADGFWKDAHNAVRTDDIVVFEVMTDELDRDWWRDLRRELEASFQQEEIVIRSHVIERL